MVEETIADKTVEIDPAMSVMPGPGLMDVPTVIPELTLASQSLAERVSFAQKAWKDGAAGGTPITAAELNRLEQGVADLTAAVNALRDSVGQHFMPRGRVPAGGDANDAKSPGSHVISYEKDNEIRNMPAGSYRYGSLLVFSNEVHVVQMYVTDESRLNIYARTLWISRKTWTEWARITAA